MTSHRARTATATTSKGWRAVYRDATAVRTSTASACRSVSCFAALARRGAARAAVLGACIGAAPAATRGLVVARTAALPASSRIDVFITARRERAGADERRSECEGRGSAETRTGHDGRWYISQRQL